MKMHKNITPRRVVEAVREQMFGTQDTEFCVACGEPQEGVEPDAERYECECCGERKVYGAEILLVAMGGGYE